jgi:hypothetical protein
MKIRARCKNRSALAGDKKGNEAVKMVREKLSKASYEVLDARSGVYIPSPYKMGRIVGTTVDIWPSALAFPMSIGKTEYKVPQDFIRVLGDLSVEWT